MRSLLILAMLSAACGDDRPQYPPGGGGGVPPSGHGTVSPPMDGGAPDGGTGQDGGMTPPDLSCGGQSYACAEREFANCCADVFTTCPEDYPYFCPSANQCMFDPEPCADPETCGYRGRACQ